MRLLLYLTGLMILYTGIYFVRKSEEKQNAVIYLVFTAVLFMMIQTVEAGIINRIPILRISAAVFGLLHIIEGVVLWYWILVKKSRQTYYFELSDVGVLAILAAFVAVVAVRQFGVQLDNFNFRADSDAARHYMYARNVAESGQLISMFFSALNSGLIMNALKDMIRGVAVYKLFIVFEIFVLYLNGAMFWTLIRRYLNSKFSIIIGTITTIVYMLGYPWNSMVFGSSYLSTGIMCVTITIFLVDIFYNDIFHSKYEIVGLLIISCYSVFVSYLLFIPPILGIVGLSAILKYIKKGYISKKAVCMVVAPFMVVCLLASAIFMYLWLVRGAFDNIVGALSWWGCSYSTLYSDFLFVIPFCIFWMIKSIKNRIINIECLVLTVFFLYIVVLFVGNHFGRISAYYYFKMYSILWIVVFMMMTITIISLKKDMFVFSYSVMWGVLLIVYISSAEKRLPQEYNLKLIDTSTGISASDYFGLYDCNVVYGHQDTISKAKKELYMEAAKLSAQTGEFIPYIGEYKDHEWTYFALAGRDHVDVTVGKNYMDAVEELKKYPYILSVECEEPMIDVSRFLNTLSVVYENEAGKICRVDNNRAEAFEIDDIDVDIILRYGLPKLERMGWVEQDEYVNSLQVIQKIDKLGLDKKEFLYPELGVEKVEESVYHLTDGHYNNRKEIKFTGTTSRELQQAINNHPDTLIDICSKQIELNEAIILQDNTALNGNGVKFVGNGLEYGFVGESVSDIYLHDISIEGQISYGIYLSDCCEVSISGCRINGLLQKAVCIIGDARGINIYGSEICNNKAGGLHIAGNVSECTIEDNKITGNGGNSKWMSGIVLTSVMPEAKYDIWGDFDEQHAFLQSENIDLQMDYPHDFIVRDNRISDNSSVGIYLDGVYKGYIIGNTICQNTCGGMSLECDTMGCYLEGNIIERNGESDVPGIALDNAAYNILRNNTITDHNVGIKMVQASVRNLVMENKIQGGENEVCHQYGIEVGNGDEENEHIDVAPSYENIICRNNIMGNHYSGVFIDEDCYVNDVFDNVIMGVRMFSVEAVSDMFNSIINNTSDADVRIEYR